MKFNKREWLGWFFWSAGVFMAFVFWFYAIDNKTVSWTAFALCWVFIVATMFTWFRWRGFKND